MMRDRAAGFRIAKGVGMTSGNPCFCQNPIAKAQAASGFPVPLSSPRGPFMSSTTAKQTIRVGHSPDSDDAFMFYALANDKLDTGGLHFVHQLEDIETLNRRALQGELEVSAVSIHAFAHLTERYALLSSGCSMGDRYGPKLIAKEPLTLDQVRDRKIVIPGKLTTAYLAFQLCLGPDVPVEVLPFDQIVPAVLEGRADVGLIIHEGQLYYPDRGLHQVLDVGEWWFEQTGLPLPLGGNVVRKDLGPEVIQQVGRLIREGIEYALNNREEALEYALEYARGLDRKLADKFIGMYVNQWTVDYGERGREAVRTLLSRAADAGLAPRVSVEFAS